MNKAFLIFLVSIFFCLLASTANAQFLKRKKQEITQKNEIDTPKKRNKSRQKNETETKVKVKRKSDYIEKKSKTGDYKINLSKKSIESPAPVEDGTTLTRKKNKPLKSLKKSQKKSERMANSQGNVRVEKR